MAKSRRTVTVLFCDVVDSTALGERLDPEALRTQLASHFEEARAVLELHGGTVEKFIGDAVVAVFGWPAVHEDDALRAVRAATELRARLTELPVRIGVNTGEVAAGGGEYPLVTGAAVNAAKRLEEAAGAGEALIGEATRRLVAGAVELEPVSGPLGAWRLVDVLGDARGFARRLDAPLVGRGDELERLRQELELARDGCRVCTVMGPPGIGKSRLAFELAEELREQATVLTGRCLPYGEGITFWPLHDLLRDAGGDEELAAALADGGTDEVFRATRLFLERQAARGRLVVVLEDIHWAEPTFLDLVEYLVGWSSAPILLLCLARPELLERRAEWGTGHVLLVGPLSEAESELLLEGVAGELDADSRRRIGEAAEGNPLFAEQMAALALQAGEVAVPPSIQALLAARLDRLAPDERAVIERAAVVGREFSRGAVADLAPDELRGEVGRLLFALVRKELIRPGGGDDGFAFRHILIRDAAYEGIPKRLRADLHERVAGRLEAQPELEEIAGYHLEQAHRYRVELDEPDPGLAERAAALLGAAGRRAYDRSDMPAAINLLERALALAPPDDRERPELMRRLSSGLWATGDLARAEQTLEEAIAEAVRTGERSVELAARLEAAGRQSMNESGLSLTEVEEIAREAVRVFEELGDHAGLARAWRRLAVAAMTACRFGEAERAAERALKHARRGGDAHELGRIVDGLCTSLLYGPAPAEAAVRRCRDLLEEAHGNRLLEANVLSSLAGLVAMLGRFDDSRAAATRARSIFQDLGLRLASAGLSEIAGPAELLAGDAAAAEAELRRGVEIIQEAGEGSYLGFAAPLLAEALRAQGRLAEARDYVALGASMAASDDTMAQLALRTVQARLEAEQGDPARALELARDAVAIADGTDALVWHADALLALAAALAASNRLDQVARATREACALYERKGDVVSAARARAGAGTAL